jgi:hypothetical protein
MIEIAIENTKTTQNSKKFERNRIRVCVSVLGNKYANDLFLCRFPIANTVVFWALFELNAKHGRTA